jgi:hypothetical protein
LAYRKKDGPGTLFIDFAGSFPEKAVGFVLNSKA